MSGYELVYAYTAYFILHDMYVMCVLDASVHISRIWHFHLSGNALVPSETDNWGPTVSV